jgi:hypothetical protein
MLIGGISSVGRLVLGKRMSEAGVTGALSFGTSGVSSVGLRALIERRGGGAISTSGKGSGETESFEEPSWERGCCMGVFCCDTAGVIDSLRAASSADIGAG